MHFRNVFFSWELQQITDMLYVREIAEKFLGTWFQMFLSSCYFTVFRMDVRDKAAEKQFNIAIQMTVEHVSTEVYENRNGQKKQLLRKTHKCYKVSKFLRENDLVKSLFWHEINSCWVVLSKIWITDVFRTKPNISDGFCLRK